MSKIGITKNWKKFFKYCFNAFQIKTGETQDQKDIRLYRKQNANRIPASKIGLKTKTSK